MELYHLSYKKDLKILKPQIPKCINPIIEDNTIARVCFSDSIDNCLSALLPVFYKDIYIYKPIEKIKIKKPKISQVRDCKETKEVWCLNDVSVECIGKIHVIEELGKKRFKNYRGHFNIFYYKWINV